MEAVLALGMSVVVLVSQWELTRRALAEVTLHQAAFLAVRTSVLGTRAPVRRARGFWESAFGGKIPAWIARARVEVFSTARGRLGHVYVRFPAWLAVPTPDGHKRAFEVTRQCPFFYSR